MWIYFCKFYKIFKTQLSLKPSSRIYFVNEYIRTQVKLDNIFFWHINILTNFLHHNLILFSEKNYKKQAQMFYQNYSLALHTVKIFCNLILRNHWTWTWKILDRLTGLGLTLIYWNWTQRILEILYWTWIGFMMHWS